MTGRGGGYKFMREIEFELNSKALWFIFYMFIMNVTFHNDKSSHKLLILLLLLLFRLLIIFFIDLNVN